jgi:predicted patatin/cPLA2 family phospholipase
MKIGIACSVGGGKGVFVHGVLVAFAEAGLKAHLYGAASSTAIVAAYAATGQLGMLRGSAHWKEEHARYVQNDYDMSKTILESLPEATATLSVKLFKSDSAAYAVAVSAVITKEAQELTQGPQARRLGKQLVISTRKRDKSWAEKNLELRLYETGSEDVQYRLTPENLPEVLYATTRILHAWKTPAWIEGFPYIDASYLCQCPAVELAQRGCDKVIAISPEAGQVYRDFFQTEKLPSSYGKIPILIVQPLLNLAEIGVDYINVTEEGLEKAYELGLRAGTEFLQSKKAKEL